VGGQIFGTAFSGVASWIRDIGTAKALDGVRLFWAIQEGKAAPNSSLANLIAKVFEDISID
jgi:hypothetical protein